MVNYKEMTDDELVVLSQKGDEKALETILIRYKPLVYKKSRPYYLAGGDDDDVVQEGLIGLYKAVMDFKKEKFPLFNIFAGVCIERRILSAVKKASRLKHNPLNAYISLSAANNSDDGNNIEPISDMDDCNNPESILIEKESALGLEGKLNEVLSDFEMQVLLCYLNGQTYKEIADALNRDAKAVDNAMQRIKKKLEAVIQ